jgi:hypothetical protein
MIIFVTCMAVSQGTKVKKAQTIIVKIVAVLMVMVMHGRLETQCAVS